MHKPLCPSLEQVREVAAVNLYLPLSGQCFEPKPYIVAISVASETGRCARMRDSAVRHSVPLVILQHAFKYTTQRFAALIPIADAVDPDTILLNVDCYDILFIASGDEILRRYYQYGRTFVVGAEKGAFPDHAGTLVRAYAARGESTPHCRGSSLRYANCGAFATTMDGMREMMGWYSAMYPNSRCLCDYLQTKECKAHTTLANDQACMHRFVLAHWNRTALDCGALIMNMFRTNCKSLRYKALTARDAPKLDLGLVITTDAMQTGGLVLHASGKSKAKLDSLQCCVAKISRDPDPWNSLLPAGVGPGCCCTKTTPKKRAHSRSLAHSTLT